MGPLLLLIYVDGLDSIQLLPSESDATCPSELYSQVMTDRREYDSDDSSVGPNWDPLVRDDITDLGMNAPLYGGSRFSIIEAMLMVLRFSLRLKPNRIFL